MRELTLTIIILLGSIAIDLIFGEPREYLHPVVYIGKLASSMENSFRKLQNKIVAGLFFDILVIAITAILFYFILYISSFIIVIYVVVAMVLLKTTFSLTAMGEHVRLVSESLKTGNLMEARIYLSRIVRRNTDKLNESEISSATIETISEGLVDGFMTPIFFFIFFGIIGAFVARAINTLDSMYAYKDRKNFEFGRWTAIFDTAINYIPARISSFFIIFSSDVLNYRVKKIRIRDYTHRTDSVNAGWPMSAIASALNVRLEKKGHYIINDAGFPPSVNDIDRAMRIFYLSAYSYLIIFVLPLLVLAIFLVP